MRIAGCFQVQRRDLRRRAAASETKRTTFCCGFFTAVLSKIVPFLATLQVVGPGKVKHPECAMSLVNLIQSVSMWQTHEAFVCVCVCFQTVNITSTQAVYFAAKLPPPAQTVRERRCRLARLGSVIATTQRTHRLHSTPQNCTGIRTRRPRRRRLHGGATRCAAVGM